MAIPRIEFSLKPFESALVSLEKALNKPADQDDLVRDAVIQRFEFTFEICWKSLKRYFEFNNGLKEDNVKNLFREAGRQGLIASVEDWFAFQSARNLTSHTYSEAVAKQVFQTARQFSREARTLLEKLKKLNV